MSGSRSISLIDHPPAVQDQVVAREYMETKALGGSLRMNEENRPARVRGKI